MKILKTFCFVLIALGILLINFNSNSSTNAYSQYPGMPPGYPPTGISSTSTTTGGPIPCTYAGNLECAEGAFCPPGQVCTLIPGAYPSCACQVPMPVPSLAPITCEHPANISCTGGACPFGEVCVSNDGGSPRCSCVSAFMPSPTPCTYCGDPTFPVGESRCCGASDLCTCTQDPADPTICNAPPASCAVGQICIATGGMDYCGEPSLPLPLPEGSLMPPPMPEPTGSVPGTMPPGYPMP